MIDLCIYHANCLDGFAAAWAVHRAHPNAEFVAAQHGSPPPANIDGREIVIVDFSYKRPVLFEMAARAKSILILDHHKTAADDLAEGLPENVSVHFDMEHSGCVLAWQHFHPNADVPELLMHVEDRDLWRFHHVNTRVTTAALGSVRRDFSAWDVIVPEYSHSLAAGGRFRAIGWALCNAHDEQVASAVRNARFMTIGGFEVLVANAPHFLASDVGHALTANAPFGATYFDATDARVFSLRSTDAGEDVSAIAKLYGGGGHRNAAGFRVPFSHPLARGDVEQQAAGAPSAQQPLDDSANNAGVATGSRNESPSESVTRGSLPPSIEQRARELLDSALREIGLHEDAYHIGCGGDLDPFERASICAIAAALRSVEQPFVNLGDSEDRYVADGRDLNCPACGGSGHVDDIRDLADMLDPAKAADVLRRKIDALPSAPEPVTAAFASACRDPSFVEWALRRIGNADAAPPAPRSDDTLKSIYDSIICSVSPDDPTLDVAYAIARYLKLDCPCAYERSDDAPRNGVLPSEAVFAFAAMLTCREGSLTVGATHDAAPMAQIADEFCKARNWQAPRDDVYPHNTLPHLTVGTRSFSNPAPQQREGASELPPMPKPTAFLVCRGSDVTARAWTIDQMRDYARAAVAAMSNPQHPSEVVAALRRFIETTQDEETTDLGRPMLDALVALGYLTKSKRNWWEITERGEQVANAQQAPLRPVTDLFDPARLPPRREDGCVWHPDVTLRCLYDFDPDDEAPISAACLSSLGWEMKIVTAEIEHDEGPSWVPPSPGPEWRLACITDDEDGCWNAWFMRRIDHVDAAQLAGEGA